MIGDIKIWHSNTLPIGWLLLNGDTFDEALYPELYAFLGTNVLPDFRGRTPVGKSTEIEFDTLGETGGSKTHTHATADHTLTIEEMPSHNHGRTDALYNAETLAYGVYGQVYKGATSAGVLSSPTENTGGGQAHNHGNTGSANNFSPYIVTNYIICASLPNNVKISELDSASSIDGTEVLPIVQSGDTKNVSVSVLLNGKADANHNHDDRYYTETEINTLLLGKQNTITSGTANPSGGSDGDIYFQYS